MTTDAYRTPGAVGLPYREPASDQKPLKEVGRAVITIVDGSGAEYVHDITAQWIPAFEYEVVNMSVASKKQKTKPIIQDIRQIVKKWVKQSYDEGFFFVGSSIVHVVLRENIKNIEVKFTTVMVEPNVNPAEVGLNKIGFTNIRAVF